MCPLGMAAERRHKCIRDYLSTAKPSDGSKRAFAIPVQDTRVRCKVLIIKGTRGTDSEHDVREQHIALVKMGEHDRVADVGDTGRTTFPFPNERR